jgi:hypothetical protein
MKADDDRPNGFWVFTVPEEQAADRRGDPLGLRGIADDVADILAPGLSNRTVDARWLTILCWILREAERAWGEFEKGAEPPDHSAAAGARFYNWVRPLELLWVDAALEHDHEEIRRQVPGARAVRRWRRGDADGGARARFGMSSTQYDRYRYTGVYGAYRRLLCSLPGLTRESAGWCVADCGRRLSQLVPLSPRHGSRVAKGRRASPESYWLPRIEDRIPPAWLPSLRTSTAKLRGEERLMLEAALFGRGKSTESGGDAVRRRRVARLIGSASGLRCPDHVSLCAALARGLRSELSQLEHLPEFARLADAGVDALVAAWTTLQGRTAKVPLAEVDRDAAVRRGLQALRAAARGWQTRTVPGSEFPQRERVDLLALSAGECRTSIGPLIEFHERQHGGQQWFALRGKQLVRELDHRASPTSPYRFRLRALARLAVQCGVIGEMPSALGDDPGLEEE